MSTDLSNRWKTKIKNLLLHPLTREFCVDHPQTTALRRQIIREKKFLQLIYKEWYKSLSVTLPPGKDPVLEIGSGAGFLSDFIPNLITSEVFYTQWISLVLDGQRLPFADNSLRGIVMIDVLHHLPRVQQFFSEGARCVRQGGVITMVEPWVSRWSKFFYCNLLEEPFKPDVVEWEFPVEGPLSGANAALPWILFKRDRKRFECEFPEWKINSLNPGMPFKYLLSGGISMRSLMPAWTFRFWSAVENRMSRFDFLSLFALIVLKRKDVKATT